MDLLINTLDTSTLIEFWMNYCSHKNAKVEFLYNNKSINGTFKCINQKGQAVINYNNEYIEYDGAINIV